MLKRVNIIFKFVRQVIFAGIMGLASSKKKTNCTVGILHLIFLDNTFKYVTPAKVEYPLPNTRKHSSRMHTAYLETVGASVSVATTR